MKGIVMYMHGGSENHGCEAIVRSTVKLVESDSILYSRNPEMDTTYNLNNICEIKNRGEVIKQFDIKWFIRQIKKRLFGDRLAFIRHNYCNILNEADPNMLYLSIGGDNYCGKLIPALKYTNKNLNESGVKTILWGCSIDPEYIKSDTGNHDLKLYTKIFAREKTTYQALIDNGLGSKARYYPDPAFILEQEKWKLPDIFYKSKVIGINISPYVQKNGKKDIIFENYVTLIEYILNATDYSIALIPHVIWDESDDRIPLNRLYEKYHEDRVVYIKDQNCCRLKYCIANCEMLVTARTHASIAGYSTYVPTLVVGYSMKSKAIANDIFGCTEHYVVSASLVRNNNVLLDEFKWQYEHKEIIRNYLKNFMPDYIKKVYSAGIEIKEMLDE
ncbi:MAG: polysaccharide pyruvyl transferase family protein [Erysipelotrichaceae bacterium]|nr:polysaccharide pyruvyl transferase family protein [Erysipelotrichaceae bacterium]